MLTFHADYMININVSIINHQIFRKVSKFDHLSCVTFAPAGLIGFITSIVLYFRLVDTEDMDCHLHLKVSDLGLLLIIVFCHCLICQVFKAINCWSNKYVKKNS